MYLTGWVQHEKNLTTACAPPAVKCKRACGVLFQYFKLAAGFLIGKRLLNPLFVSNFFPILSRPAYTSDHAHCLDRRLIICCG